MHGVDDLHLMMQKKTTKRKSIKVKCHSAEMMSKGEKLTFSEVKVKAIFTHVYAN